jgi:hypothetical protein
MSWREKRHACRRLLSIADSFIGARVELSPTVILEEWARATKAFRGTILLAGDGYGPQSQVLARAIFGSAMLIAWAVRNPDTADDNVHLHTQLGLELHQAARRNAGFWADPPKSHLTKTEREAAVTLFGRRGTRFWSGHRSPENLVRENVGEIEDPFTKSQYQATLTSSPVGPTL